MLSYFPNWLLIMDFVKHFKFIEQRLFFSNLTIAMFFFTYFALFLLLILLYYWYRRNSYVETCTYEDALSKKKLSR